MDLVQRINPMKRTPFTLLITLVLALGLAACAVETVDVEVDVQSTAAPTPQPEANNLDSELSPSEIATLNSLEQIDDYPLYTMAYQADYRDRVIIQSYNEPEFLQIREDAWGCSLFAALGDSENLLFGRNFDWVYSPALLLMTDPPSGYASASMVNLGFLGYRDDQVNGLADRPLGDRLALLDSVYLPIDGFNEMGLAVGMAAVPGDNPMADTKPRIGSLGIMRVLLDHAATVGEAVALMDGFAIDFSGGPVVHYLIADATGRAVLVEYDHGEMHLFYNDSPWHQATNFLRVTEGDSPDGKCWRYDAIFSQMAVRGGVLSEVEAMDLLEDVSQENTQWSVLYDLTDRRLQIVMGRDYGDTIDLNTQFQ